MSLTFRYILGFIAILMAWCGGYYCGVKDVREERVLLHKMVEKLGRQIGNPK